MKTILKKILQRISDKWHRIKYKWSGRHKYVNDVHHRILSVPTQKKADLIEVEINRKLEEDLLVVERSNLEALLSELNDRRNKL